MGKSPDGLAKRNEAGGPTRSEPATHKYFNESSPNIYRSSEIWGSGLAGGTLNGLETDEDGNIIGFNPQNFIKGFLVGAGGAKAVKLAIQKSPAIRAKAEKFAAKSAEFLNEALQNPLMLPQERARFAVVANKALNSALDNRKFIIGGEGAIGANRDKLATARSMQKQGKDEGEIWDKTGWYLDKDGKWKFEINAAGGEWIQEPTENASGKLSDFLDDEELFKAYPKLKEINLEVRDLGHYDNLGQFDINANTIILAPSYEDNMKRTLYHEIQHAVQRFENFAQGGNAQIARAAIKRPENAHLVDAINAEVGADYKGDFKKAFGNKAYFRLHGEAEARNVEQRMENIDEYNSGWWEGEDTAEITEQDLLNKINSHPHGTMDEALQDTIILQDKRRLRGKNSQNFAKMSAENLGKGKEMPKFEFTTPDKEKSAYELRPKTLEVLKSLSNKPIINKNDGRVAYINKKGREEMVNDKAILKSTKGKDFTPAQHMQIVEHIKELFENSRLRNIDPDTKNGDPNVLMPRYEINFMLDGEPAQAKITLKETLKGLYKGNRLYTIELESIEKLK